MKTKLTLTVRKEIVEKAKQKAASRGVSLSRMFEEIFEKENPTLEKSPQQQAAELFLEKLKKAKPIQSLDKSDKELLKEKRDRKYV